MANIVVRKKAEVIRDFIIMPYNSEITVGSDADNDLVIEDKKVSMHQFKIERFGSKYYLTDLNSAFGTQVRGHTVTTRVRLLDGDEIRIGSHTLAFMDPANVDASGVSGDDSSDLEFTTDFGHSITEEKISENDLSDLETQLAAELENFDQEPKEELSESNSLGFTDTNDPNGTPDVHGMTEADILQADPITIAKETTPLETTTGEAADDVNKAVVPSGKAEKLSGNFYLVSIYGPYCGKKYMLNKDVTKIGRDTKLNDIIIRENMRGEVDPSISRRHATITRKEDGYYITDRRSKTRTFVNQQVLSETDEVKLQPGDEIEIVSDQKSTIFRLVPEGKRNFAMPRKAGVWWVRYQTRMLLGASALALFFILLVLNSAWSKRNILVQKPDPLTIQESLWIPAQDKSQTFYMQDAGGYNTATAPALGDVNGDDVLDVVFVDTNGKLKIFDGKSKESVFKNDMIPLGMLGLAPLLADLNNNNLADVVFTGQDMQLFAVDGFNNGEIWSSSLLNGPYSGSQVVADFNGDKLADIVAVTQSGQVHVGFGSLVQPNWVSYELGHPSHATPSAADFDGDGLPELLIGTEDGWVIVFDVVRGMAKKQIDINEELNKAKGTYYEDNQIRASVASADLNGDGKRDIALMTRQGNVLAIDGYTMKRLWFDALLENEPMAPAIQFSPSVGDLDGDHNPDVVVCTPNGIVRAYKGSGNEGSDKASILWQSTSDAWESLMAAPTLADLNKDGADDVIICGAWSGVTVYNGKDGKRLWKSPKNDELIITVPLVADLEGDGYLDILYRRSDNSFYKASTNALVPKNASIWPQLNGNAMHTGVVAYKLPSAFIPTLMIIAMVMLFVIIIYLNIARFISRIKLAKSAA